MESNPGGERSQDCQNDDFSQCNKRSLSKCALEAKASTCAASQKSQLSSTRAHLRENAGCDTMVDQGTEGRRKEGNTSCQFCSKDGAVLERRTEDFRVSVDDPTPTRSSEPQHSSYGRLIKPKNVIT
ncbi:hypothetical protein X975_14075, partial [Stegodyphus mimosarum]